MNECVIIMKGRSSPRILCVGLVHKSEGVVVTVSVWEFNLHLSIKS